MSTTFQPPRLEFLLRPSRTSEPCHTLAPTRAVDQEKASLSALTAGNCFQKARVLGLYEIPAYCVYFFLTYKMYGYILI